MSSQQCNIVPRAHCGRDALKTVQDRQYLKGRFPVASSLFFSFGPAQSRPCPSPLLNRGCSVPVLRLCPSQALNRSFLDSLRVVPSRLPGRPCRTGPAFLKLLFRAPNHASFSLHTTLLCFSRYPRTRLIPNHITTHIVAGNHTHLHYIISPTNNYYYHIIPTTSHRPLSAHLQSWPPTHRSTAQPTHR